MAMLQHRVTILMVILFVAGNVGFLIGIQRGDPLVNDLALVSMLAGWVAARWLDERTNPLYAGKKVLPVLLALSIPAFAGFLMGVVLLRPFPEHLRILAGISGIIGWVVLRAFFAVQNRNRLHR